LITPQTLTGFAEFFRYVVVTFGGSILPEGLTNTTFLLLSGKTVTERMDGLALSSTKKSSGETSSLSSRMVS
jgi:hypothetical protein